VTNAESAPDRTNLAMLLDFLARADDVISVTQGEDSELVRISVPGLDGDHGTVSPAALVTTDRHRVWLIHIQHEGDHPATLTSLAVWCRRQTLHDEAGRTFRPLLLSAESLPVPLHIASFEALATL
jgi:hypothetical protein